MNKYLIVGLGNVGDEYARTRHNIGFNVLEVFVEKHKGSFTLDRLAYKAEISIKGRKIICIKPTTFMNLSGKAFKYWMDKENIAVENTLTIVDDLALPLSKLRLRASGSAAGHNGLKDIQLTLGTDVYSKLRFGIGNSFPKGMQVQFVLGNWWNEEIPVVNQKIVKCSEIIEEFVLLGIEKTMANVNNLSFTQ